MLFKNQNLRSPFDFDQILPDDESNINALSKHIQKQIDTIGDMLDDGERVELFHTDNNYEPIFIDRIKGDVAERTREQIEQLLYRPTGSKTTMAKYLSEWGVKEPEEGSSGYKEYIKLLYFFYMVQYVIFDEENIFNLLKWTNLSTDISPLQNASKGKYFCFILSNFLDDLKACEYLANEDFYVSLHINNITKVINHLVTYRNPETTRYIDIIESFIGRIKKENYNDADIAARVMDQAVDYIYRYQNVAYAEEMICTLQDSNCPFQFGELDPEIDPYWQTLFIPADVKDCMKLLAVKEAKAFYMQSHTNYPKYMEEFVENILEYDKEIFSTYGQGFLIEADENDDYIISAHRLLVAAKTFLDLSTSKYKLKVKVSMKKWEHTQSFRKTLTGSPADIAMRYFFIAFESELMNSVLGHGYYPVVYKPIYIRRYQVIQEIMKEAFSIRNPEVRDEYMLRILNEITIRITLNQG